MRKIVPFPFRCATPSGVVLYRVNECGHLVVRGTVPPFPALAGTFWEQAINGNEWVLRTPGEPTTMANVLRTYGPMVVSRSDKYGVDERVTLVSIACESGGDPKAQRAEPGYPDYPVFNQALANKILSPARDALDVAHGKGMHASYGLTQLLLGTAKTVEPSLFSDDASTWRETLFQPLTNIDIGSKLYAGAGAKTGNLDPVAIRFQAGAGSDQSTPNGVHVGHAQNGADHGWGARSYSEEIILRFMAFWNDLQSIEVGAAACAPFVFGVFSLAIALCAFAPHVAA